MSTEEEREVALKYRKKPIVIEAFQMTEARCKDRSEWPNWLQEARNKDAHKRGAIYYENGRFRIQTLEGIHIVDWDDFIIQGVNGEIYPCKPDIFEATYDAVED